jgi:hypothetical protein
VKEEEVKMEVDVKEEGAEKADAAKEGEEGDKAEAEPKTEPEPESEEAKAAEAEPKKEGEEATEGAAEKEGEAEGEKEEGAKLEAKAKVEAPKPVAAMGSRERRPQVKILRADITTVKSVPALFARNLYIANLKIGFNDHAVFKQTFEDFGPVNSCSLARTPGSNHPKVRARLLLMSLCRSGLRQHVFCLPFGLVADVKAHGV